MRTFYVRVRGAHFEIDIDGKSTRAGFYSTFAVAAEDERGVRKQLLLDLAQRLKDTGVRTRNGLFFSSFCSIDDFNEYEQAPDPVPAGFSFYRWRIAGVLPYIVERWKIRLVERWRVLGLDV